MPERDSPTPPPSLPSRERRGEGTPIRPVNADPAVREERERAAGHARRSGGFSPWAPLLATDHLPALTDPFAPATEQYRMLRVRLDAIDLPGVGVPRVIAVTSAFPDEGKTCTALNLAIVAAQDPDRRVVFVEADLRRPRVRLLLARPAATGLSEALGGKAPLADMLVHMETPPNLSILLAGRPPNNPVELLASEAMGTVLSWMRDHHDLVVVDAPPAMHFADASQLAANVDGFLLVVRSGRTPREALLRTHRLLAPHHVVGVVLNNIDPGPGSGYGYYRYPRRAGTEEGEEHR